MDIFNKLNNKLKIAAKCKHKPTEEEIKIIAALSLQIKSLFPRVYKFINCHNDCPASALIAALQGIQKYKPDNAWAYAVKIIKEQTKDFNALKNIEEGNQLKKMSLKPFKDALRDILRGIFLVGRLF